ncbi:hypothetical protein TGRH88_029280 [Toxoplasma gondii]|uniref:Transmembrane protein n=1 Tax=Toxoplasma gondii TaxID=5811 RepID=A0A7J6K9T4_TOXGO|nr:hypothetical protein TGRH88_029280 [Toxoplasma gondii]
MWAFLPILMVLGSCAEGRLRYRGMFWHIQISRRRTSTGAGPRLRRIALLLSSTTRRVAEGPSEKTC